MISGNNMEISVGKSFHLIRWYLFLGIAGFFNFIFMSFQISNVLSFDLSTMQRLKAFQYSMIFCNKARAEMSKSYPLVSMVQTVQSSHLCIAVYNNANRL